MSYGGTLVAGTTYTVTVGAQTYHFTAPTVSTPGAFPGFNVSNGPAPILPTVTSVSPSRGSTAGGTAITITGSDFTGVTGVTVGGTAATGVTFVSDTQITATTPAGPAGLVNVYVTTANGTGTGSGLFTYVAPPTVTNVTSSTANGTYKIGDTISIQVAFSGSVDVTGTPQLQLNSGGTATYASGTGTSTLSFTYTVLSGENSSDLDYSSTSSLGLNGGTIRAAGTAVNAVLTLPTVGGVNSLAGNKNIVIDTISPTVTSVSVPTNGTYRTGQNLDFTVNLSESVTVNTGGGTPYLSLTIGTSTVQASYQSGSGTSALVFRYTVATGDTSNGSGVSLGSSVTLNGGSITDAAGNNLTTTLNSVSSTASVLVNALAPTVTAVSPNTGATAGGTTITITGTGFTGVTGVTVGGTAATGVTFVSDTQITAITPAGTAGVVKVAVITPNGKATRVFTYVEKTPKSAFDEYKNDVKRIIQDQAEQHLTTSINDNMRMMQDARTRFIGLAENKGDQQAGLISNGFEAIPFDVDGTVDISGDLNGIVAASSGEFLGQTGMRDGANWRLSGNFDVLIDGDQNMAAFDGRVAREQFLRENLLWGAFGGGQFSDSSIADTLNGSETTWQLYLGTYAVTQLTSNLFADGYASVGYGWSDLNMENDVLSLDSNYGTATWQVGGSLTGLIEMERFSLLPRISLAYGNSNLGEVDFTAGAYGLSDGVSLDADHVAMGVLRLTPEVRIPLGPESTTAEGVTLGLLPSLICQQVVADRTESGCGWGAGIELMQQGDGGLGQFNGRMDYEFIDGISRIGGQLGYSIQF